MTAVLAAAALAACGPGRTTFARSPGAAPAFDRAASDPKAVEIADKVLATAGGSEAWNRVKQIRWKMVGESDGKVIIEYDEAWDRWNGRAFGRLYNATGAAAEPEPSGPPKDKQPTDGSVVIMRKLYEAKDSAYFVKGGAMVKLPDDQRARAVATASEHWQRNTALLLMPFLLEEPGTKLELTGEEEAAPGKPALANLKVTLDPNEPGRAGVAYQVFVDRETHTIDRIEIHGKELFGYRLRERITVGGLSVPTVFESLGGERGEKITYKEIAVGEPDEDLYVVPLNVQ